MHVNQKLLHTNPPMTAHRNLRIGLRRTMQSPTLGLEKQAICQKFFELI